MGRKIEMKKIEDLTKCQVTYSKRRSSLMKKANELAVCCEVDVAFVAFSPSGRISKFSNQPRLEDVLVRYVSVPPEKRFNSTCNVQGKLEKLRNLTDHITGGSSKIHFLDKQIENLQLQIQKSGLELQILQAALGDYEPSEEECPSLHQLAWCERNLMHSFERVFARKNALEGNSSSSCGQSSFQMDQMEFGRQLEIPFSSGIIDNKFDSMIENPTAGYNLNQADNGMNYSLEDIIKQATSSTNHDIGSSSKNPNIPMPMNTYAFAIPRSPINGEFEVMLTSNAQTFPYQMPLEKPLMIDQTTFNMDGQQGDVAYDAKTLVNVNYPGVIYMPNQSLSDIPGPSCFASMPTVETNYGNTKYMPDEIVKIDRKKGKQIMYSNSSQENTKLNVDIKTSFSNGSTSGGNNAGKKDEYRVDTSHIYKSDNQPKYNLLNDELLLEDTFGVNMVWPSRMEKNHMPEWEDLDLDNFNFQASF